MLLKRHFATPPGWEARRNARLPGGSLMVPSLSEGDCLNPPPLDFVEVHHTGAGAAQKFSREFVENGLREGWVSFDAGVLLVSGKLVGSGDDVVLRYKVNRSPGCYCMICGERMPDNDQDGHKARDHVAAVHPGANPLSYTRVHCYECELDEDQQALYSMETYSARRAGGGV